MTSETVKNRKKGAAAAADEETVEREYQAAIEALLERASQLVSFAGGNLSPDRGTVQASPDSRTQPDEEPASPTAADVGVKEASPGESEPVWRSHPVETIDQIRALRDVAKTSARQAISTHVQRLKARARGMLGSAMLASLTSLALALLPFQTGFASHLVAWAFLGVAVLLAVEYFRLVRHLASVTPSLGEPEPGQSDLAPLAEAPAADAGAACALAEQERMPAETDAC